MKTHSMQTQHRRLRSISMHNVNVLMPSRTRNANLPHVSHVQLYIRMSAVTYELCIASRRHLGCAVELNINSCLPPLTVAYKGIVFIFQKRRVGHDQLLWKIYERLWTALLQSSALIVSACFCVDILDRLSGFEPTHPATICYASRRCAIEAFLNWIETWQIQAPNVTTCAQCTMSSIRAFACL